MCNFTTQEIFNDLDKYGPYINFLDLADGYFFTAGSRINLFADDDRWAIVFEKSGYHNRGGRAEIELSYFGNCLENLETTGLNGKFVSNSKRFTLIDGENFNKIEADFELVSKKADVVKVRDKQLPIEQNQLKYKAKNIDIQQFDNVLNRIDYPALVRYLDEEYPNVFRATPFELRSCIPGDLRFIMHIDQWHHRYYTPYGGEKPSSYETFRQIADVLVSKDKACWNPSLRPNNDWRNWPGAGNL